MVILAAMLAGSWSNGETGGDAGAADSLIAEPETVSVATEGILYLYGHRMEPPFVFVLERDTVWVNGVQFSPAIRSDPPVVRAEADRTPNPEHQLNVAVSEELNRLLAEGVPYDSVASRAVEMFRASDLMDSVVVVRYKDIVMLKKYWKSTPWPEHLTVRKRIPPPPRPLSEFRRNNARRHANSLQGGAMLIWGEGQRLIVSRHNVTRVEDQIRRLKARGAPVADDRAKFGEEGVRELLDPIPLEGGERR
jgi:hypothetical protein